MAADARWATALTHNPPLLCWSKSAESGINPLPTPKSAFSYLHKVITETDGEQRGAGGPSNTPQYAPLLGLFNDVPPSPGSPSNSTRIDLFKVVNRLIYHQGQKPY